LHVFLVVEDDKSRGLSSFLGFFHSVQKTMTSFLVHHRLLFFFIIIHKGTTCHAQDLM
jgi:hypothetical protein